MTQKEEDSFLKRSYINQTHGYIDIFPRRELWMKMAEEFNGNFKISHTRSYVIEYLELRIPYKDSELIFTESDTRPLKIECEFISKIPYNLIIGDEDMFEKLLKRFGKKEIEIGNPEFDGHYLIESKDTDLTTNLLSTDIAGFILKCKVYSISFSTNLKKQTSSLISVINRFVDEAETFRDVVVLHFKLLDKLSEISII